jgi:hypothetical protein
MGWEFFLNSKEDNITPKDTPREMGRGMGIDRMRKQSPRDCYNNYGVFFLRNGGGFPKPVK